MNEFTQSRIAMSFSAGEKDVRALVAPLIELADESQSLVVGYGIPRAGAREDAIPYFHVVGGACAYEPVRMLIVGGWVGTQPVTTYTIARLLAAMEERMSLVAGLEITAFPAANLDAQREDVFLTGSQQANGVALWQDSSSEFVKVFERELQRYEYDIVVHLREHPRAIEPDLEAWAYEDDKKQVLGNALEQYSKSGPRFKWRMNPLRPKPVYTRVFTPMPNVERQPAEIVIGLPSARPVEEQVTDGIGLVLFLAHAARQAREEGLF